MLAPTGVLNPGASPVDGIFDPEKDSADLPGLGSGTAESNKKPGPSIAGEVVNLALKAHYADWYKEVPRDFVAKISSWDENTLAISRTMLRNNSPGNNVISVHYDGTLLRHGEPTRITTWMPIGKISLIGGGLIYLTGTYNIPPPSQHRQELVQLMQDGSKHLSK